MEKPIWCIKQHLNIQQHLSNPYHYLDFLLKYNRNAP